MKKIISLDLILPFPYAEVLRKLPAEGTVSLLDGSQMTQKDLCLKIISLDLNDSEAYFVLAEILELAPHYWTVL